MTYTPGPGDILGQYAGHPHDPRTPDGDDDTTTYAIAEVRIFIAAAETAACRGDMDKAREALLEAKLSIEELLGAEA